LAGAADLEEEPPSAELNSSLSPQAALSSATGFLAYLAWAAPPSNSEGSSSVSSERVRAVVIPVLR
jgi:hypothetical protein